MRYAITVLCLLALACGKKDEPAAAAPESEPAPVRAEQPAEQPSAADSPEPMKALDPAKAKAFVAYQEQFKVALQKGINAGAKVGAKQEGGEYKGVVGTLKGMHEI